ncbi:MULTISPECIES: ArpU family phage packaging/lysis transcriptional regulator [Bacillaceae]|uniref:ArpU family phage packaging/lysis transcriptional regulator n=1 Tax=Bacillaceae TaxID=186817 RepID=UPI001CCE8F4B|nr:ArpU family phage packaging/lysis transcriptional regulator [Cytobacillus oceanisediminis]
MSLFSDVDDKEIRRVVARLLKQYKAYRVAFQNKLEQDAEGIDQLFPMLNDIEKEKFLFVKQIDRAIENALNEIEREIIQRKYLDNHRVKDIDVYLDLGLTKDQYYIHKKYAINLIATALRII